MIATVTLRITTFDHLIYPPSTIFAKSSRQSRGLLGSLGL